MTCRGGESPQEGIRTLPAGLPAPRRARTLTLDMNTDPRLEESP